MAYVTYGPTSPLASGLMGLSQAAEGRAEGEVFKEGKRQFNEDLALKRDTFEESKIQWDEDMEHKYSVLKQAKDEGKLNRDQQERFARMDDARAREMQKSQLDFNIYFAKKVEQPFMAEQAEMDRTVTKRGQDLTYRADTYRTKKTWDAEMSRLAENRNQSQRTAGTAITIGTEILGNQDFHNLLPEQQAAVVQRATEQYIGIDRMRGSPGVEQATAEEIAAATDHVTDVLANLPARKAEFMDTQLQLAKAQSAVRNAAGASIEHRAPFKTLAPTKEWASLGLGVAERDPKSMAPDDYTLHNEIFALVGEARAEMASGAWDDRGAEVVESEYYPEIMKRISQMQVQDDQVRDYYKAMLSNVIYPNGAMQSMSMD